MKSIFFCLSATPRISAGFREVVLRDKSIFSQIHLACYPLNFGSYVTVDYFPEGDNESSPFSLHRTMLPVDREATLGNKNTCSGLGS